MFSKNSKLFEEYCSTPSSPKKNNNSNFSNFDNNNELAESISPNSQCQHHRKILELKQKIKQLECAEQLLMRKNDQIISGMQRMSEKERKEEEQNEVWKKKYEQLRAENDRKALKLAGNTLFSSQAPMKVNIQRQREKQRSRQYSSRQLKIQQDYQNRRKCENMEQMLTKQQRQYVKQLQQSKRQRSGSLRCINYNNQSSRKYSTMLPDGLVIHIVDDRPRIMTSRQ